MTQAIDFQTFVRRRLGADLSTLPLSAALSRLPPLGPAGPWLAGGALRRTISGQRLDSDYDFFFAGEEQFEQFCIDMKKSGGWISSSNQHCSTFCLPSTAPDQGKEGILPELKVQAIKTRWFDSAEHVIDSFDYTICQFAFDGSKLVCGELSLWDLARKRLAPHKISYAVASLRRLMKYANQGFHVCPGALSELLQQVIDNPEIVRAETAYID